MHVGLAIKNFVGPTESPDVDAILAYAERAEALGFESLWAWDHVILGRGACRSPSWTRWGSSPPSPRAPAPSSWAPE